MVIKPEIDKGIYDTQIVFKNGSCINILNKREVNNSKSIRGKWRDNFLDWSMQDGHMISEEILDEVLKPYIEVEEKTEI